MARRFSSLISLGKCKMPSMTLTLPNIPQELDAALRLRAAEQRGSVDQVAVDAMRAELGMAEHTADESPRTPLAASFCARFAPMGGVELPEPTREPMPEPSDFCKY